ncbi:hypothetical protein [Mycobacterium hubeiense]|uniref:hypothetical protein n=1 Tax=Mycobacterium hubeiense TaxID=1867256 RepID=UPI000C7F5D69|nr:hypothetical protein [Mycobacterium sp. QGD 101]
MQVLTASAGFGHTDCERIVPAALAQPVLALTSLAYVVAGLVVLYWARRISAPLTKGTAVALIAVGAGSFAYHGPQPSWAQVVHDVPIVALGTVCLVGFVVSVRRGEWSTWLAPAGIMALALIAYAAGRSGSPLCRPDSLWQYHGAWHVLSGAAVILAAFAMAPRAMKFRAAGGRYRHG